MGRRSSCGLLAAIAVCLALPAPGHGQSTLQRSPNVDGAWVGAPSTLHLGLVTRATSDDGSGDPSLRPTLFGGWGFGGYSLVGVRWTEIPSAARDEWEILARFSPLSTAFGAAFDFGLTAAWSEPVRSLDGELSVGVPAGPLSLTGVVRRFSNGFGGAGEGRWAVGASGAVPLGDRWALAADVVRPTSLAEGESLAWGAGLQVAPGVGGLSLSLHATNTRSTTLRGSSIRDAGTRVGVEVTFSSDPRTWFGGGTGPDPGERAGETDLVAGDTVRIAIGDGGFDPARVVVRPGTSVVWTNESGGIHSVTADGGAWESPLLAPGESFGRVFTEAGEFTYRSNLEPEMSAVLVVDGG